MMTDDANIDRITKRMESLMDDIKELAYSRGMSAIETMTKGFISAYFLGIS